LVSPSDNPWAYINTATRRIYERNYAETGSANPLEDVGLSPAKVNKPVHSVGAGDELLIENLRDAVLNAGDRQEMEGVAGVFDWPNGDQMGPATRGSGQGIDRPEERRTVRLCLGRFSVEGALLQGGHLP
jgi:hypothetical protein